MPIAYNADEIFRIGMEVEENGEAFYAAAAEVETDEEAKAMMEYLRDQEAAHRRIFAEMREQLPANAKPEGVYDPDGQMAAYLEAIAHSHVFTDQTQAADLARECEAAVDVLNVALQFEKDTVLLFQTMKDMTKPEWGRDRIDGLVSAEQGHVRDIAAMLAKLRAKA